jgi:hypothetical protein
VTTFGATNVDDLLLLSLFFAKRQPMRRVLVGQYLGFAGIVALSHPWMVGIAGDPVRVAPTTGRLRHHIALGSQVLRSRLMRATGSSRSFDEVHAREVAI